MNFGQIGHKITALLLRKTANMQTGAHALVREMTEISQDAVHLAYKKYQHGTLDLDTETSPIVIIHTLFEHKRHWDGIANILFHTLEPKRDIITVDCRNSGDSQYTSEHSYYKMVADIRNLVDHLRLNTISLLGFGLGGFTAMLFALLHSDMVDKLIVEDICPATYIDVERLQKILQSLRKCSLPSTIDLPEAHLRADECLIESIQDAKLRKRILFNLARSNNGRYYWKLNLKSIESNLHKIVSFPRVSSTFLGPTLFLASDEADLIKKQDTNIIRTYFPNARLKFIPNCGHYIHLDNTNDFVEAIGEFLRQEAA